MCTSTLIGDLEAAQAQATADFDKLVEAVASGEEVKEAHARTVLQAAGLSPSDLRQAVEKCGRIKGLEAEIAAGPTDLGDQLQKLRVERSEEIKRDDGEIRRLQLEGNRKHGEFRGLESRLEQQIQRRGQLQEELGRLKTTVRTPEIAPAHAG